MHIGLVRILCLWFFSAALVSAEFKTMTVDVNELYKNYHVTKKERAAFKATQDSYTKERNERKKALTDVTDKIQAVIVKLREKAMPKAEKKNLTAEYEELVSQYNALNKDFKESDRDKLNEAKKIIAEKRRKGLEEITEVVKKYAKENGYRWVMETSGVSNSQISPLVYARKTENKTKEILAILNKDAATEEEEKDRSEDDE